MYNAFNDIFKTNRLFNFQDKYAYLYAKKKEDNESGVSYF